MNEGQLIAAILRQLPDTWHAQSMTSASLTHRGTPDRYFDAPKRELWCEFKMLKAMPRSGVAVGDFSPLQLRWMDRRFRNAMGLTHLDLGRDYLASELGASNIFGIVGLPNKTAVIQRTPKEWREGTSVKTAMSLKEVAACLADFGGS